MAVLLEAEPAELVASTETEEFESSWLTEVRVYVAPVAPETATPFTRHWYVGEGVPVAATAKVTEFPADTSWLHG